MKNCYSARYCMAVLLSFGLAIIYGLKVNYHVAVVAMINHTAVTKHGKNDTAGRAEDGPFAWSENVKSLQLSAYFIGYMVAQIPGGWVSEHFSAKWVFFFGAGLNIVFTLLTPILSYVHYGAIVVVRILNGIGGGVSFPATHALLARWSPPQERSTMSSIAYCGTAAGTVLFTLFAGLISNKLGWQYVFYIEGGVSAIWMIFWVIIGSDTPAKQRFISATEKEFIIESFKEEGGADHSEMTVPFKEIMKSLPFWAIAVAHICSNWGWYMVLTELPSYMKDVLNFKIKENAMLSAMPYFIMFIFSLILGKFIDTLRMKEIISTGTGRKIATLCASLVPCICFAVLCVISSPTPAVILMTIGVTGIGGMYCGFLSNHIDISPNFAGTLMAYTNTIATIPGIVVPLFVGWLVETGGNPVASWRIVFCVTIVLYIVEMVVYTIFASGNEQPWNQGSAESEPDK